MVNSGWLLVQPGVWSKLFRGARVLYSEDLQGGLVVDGPTLRNPFLAA